MLSFVLRRSRHRWLLLVAGVVGLLSPLAVLLIFLKSQRLDQADKWASVFALILALGVWIGTAIYRFVRWTRPRSRRHLTPAVNTFGLEPPIPWFKVRGRERIVDLLSTVLADQSRDAARVHVLHGLAGVGKTAVAQAVAQRFSHLEMGRWWLDGGGQESLLGGFRELTLRLVRDSRHGLAIGREDVVGAWESDGSEPSDLLWQLLRNHPGWLITLDGLDDVDLVGDAETRWSGTRWIRPPSPNQLMIVTTVDGSMKNFNPAWVRMHLISLLHHDDGATVLREQAPEAGSNEDARILSRRLGGLPLALWMAGRFLNLATSPNGGADGETPRTFRKFRDVLDERWWDRISWRRWVVGPPAPERLIPQLWEPSLRLITEKREGLRARELLRLLACLSTRPIPVGMLDLKVLQNSVLFGRSFSADTLRRHLQALYDFGLVQLSGDGIRELITVHPLVASVNRSSVETRRRRGAYIELVRRLRMNAESQAQATGRARQRVRSVLAVPPPDIVGPDAGLELSQLTCATVDGLQELTTRLRRLASGMSRAIRDRATVPSPPRKPVKAPRSNPRSTSPREPDPKRVIQPRMARNAHLPSISPEGTWNAYYEVPAGPGGAWYHVTTRLTPTGVSGASGRITYTGKPRISHSTTGLPRHILALVNQGHPPVPLIAGTHDGTPSGKPVIFQRTPHRVIMCRSELVGVKSNGLTGPLGTYRLNQIWKNGLH